MDSGELIPDAEGKLRPAISSVTPEALLTPGELALHHAVNSGGSGRGMSFWSGAARCGRRAVLSERKYAGFRDVRSTLPILKNHFLVGSLFHAMQEGWRQEEPAYSYDSAVSYQNVNVIEAARLFTGYMANWSREMWGRTLAVECQLPNTADTASDIFTTFGVEVTGKVDMVCELGEEHLAQARRRLPDIKPGRYIVDFKTSEQPTPGSAIAYTLGLQAMWYPLLWNWAHPDRPVEGMIFDVIYKRSRRAPRPYTVDDFAAYFAPTLPGSTNLTVNALRGMIMQGKYAVDNFLPNRGECVSWRGETCQYFKNVCNTEMSQ